MVLYVSLKNKIRDWEFRVIFYLRSPNVPDGTQIELVRIAAVTDHTS